ncbi:M16 family metallopeptidase [Aquimarina sp. 2201CG14-23]|uniref:M16 family metallopeptidase n=1 Tax=Aquimarina mycalae TaxID=3040073 RepID=UPI00247807ED|nr:pitrilysin family protein [Aquimarina sp. 2201CG14-23]MDH7446444.1 pitrilysin family protein [Aquimarina sp. 2201CG14-23]
MSFFKKITAITAFSVIVFSCSTSEEKAEISDTSETSEFKIDYEKFTLDNGLEVILHEDHSDPIVAVATMMHVGSNREKPGKTGFAHFFEHMSFNDSENTPVGANRKLIPEWGGQRNGGTWTDGTVYYEVVPKDAFEKILWIDSDRYGYMINTVTEAALEREKQVVKNEKRQRVDNAPYGYTDEIIRKNLYPEGHPYSWTVIGSLPDLQSATLEDVKEFYKKYYGASNGSLVIAGDIDVEKTKELVKKWFGEIEKGPEVEPLTPMPVTLSESKSLYFEDNFAKLPELRMVFPTVEEYHKDVYALQILGQLLTGSKKSPLYKVLVEEKKLAPRPFSFQNSNELAGEFTFGVRANVGKDLDSIKAAITEGLARFEKDGFTDNELKRIKAELETGLYQGFSTVLNKAFQLVQDNEFNGDPGYISKTAKLTNAVSRDDVMRVYNTYIKGKNYVMTSVVPKGQLELAVTGSNQASVWIEEVKNDVANEEVSQGEEAVYEKTPSTHDRSEPDFGELPLFKAPAVWTSEASNGIKIFGIENKELPLVSFDITIDGGHLLDPLDKSGISSLMTSLMMEGTASKTPAELEEAIGLLGASINMFSGSEEIRITGSCLSKNFKETLALVEEILLQPRWDEQEYNRLKQALQTSLKGREANPNSIASINFNKLVYGDQHILGTPNSGTLTTINNITLEDVKAHYNTLSSKNAAFHIAGNITKETVNDALSSLATNWNTEKVEIPQPETVINNKTDQLYFIDVPNAKQSVIFIGNLALSASNEEFNNLNYANEILGGGSSGRLFQTLRIEKGYTYGAYSGIRALKNISPLAVRTSVRANATLPSLKIIEGMITNYEESFDKDAAETTKTKILKGSTRAYEGLGDKLNILREMSKYNKSESFIEDDQKELVEMNELNFKSIISKYYKENEMIYLVVGDKATQLEEVKKLNKVVTELDIHGNKI